MSLISKEQEGEIESIMVFLRNGKLNLELNVHVSLFGTSSADDP